MSALDLARLQFGITTVYHFLFVPLTISLGFLIAGFETAWVRTNKEKYLKLTHFFGELFLINFALGVVTGILQEFQFGMNWSDYSRFVGDIFGAPLAIEALLAFFLESTFLGIWIFGWDRVPRTVHLASIWIVAIGSLLSAFFILAANSFMQQPVGFKINPVSGRAELTDFIAVLTNPTLMLAMPHVIAASFMTGGAFVLAVAVWRIVRRPDHDAEIFRTAARVGAVTVIVAAGALFLVGDQLGKHLAADQPMKAAASEGLYNTSQPAPFTVLALWGTDGKIIPIIQIPNVLSFLETGDFNGKVEGINDINAQLRAQYPQYGSQMDYSPIVPVTFYSFRLMVGAAGLAGLAALWFLWSMRKGRSPGRGAIAIAAVLPFVPLAANSSGWILNEMGRQPWVVQGQLLTANAVSPNTGAMILITLIGFTFLYGVLAVVEVGLVAKVVKTDEIGTQPAGYGDAGDSGDQAATFAY
jgi:cytochrome d ubiquinol oxidase subunit I